LKGIKMGKKKKTRGHYCWVCDSILANEKFSGKGHAGHICKKCSKLSVEERNERKIINKIGSLYRYAFLSKVNRELLLKYSKYKSEKVSSEAREALDYFNTAMQEWKAAKRLEEEMETEYFEGIYLEDENEDEGDEYLYNEHEGEEIPWDDEELPF
jgi:hypothetical protein